MSTASSAVKLLIFVVVTTLATGVLAITISGTQFIPEKQYHAIVRDATGVLEGDDVRVAGVRVGEVKGVQVHDGNLAKITFTAIETRPLPESVRVAVRYRNLIGQRYLSLSQGPGTHENLEEGATIPVSQTEPALDLTVLFNGFRPLFQALQPEQVNKLAYQIVQVLQGEEGTVRGLLAHIGSLTNTIADRDAVIGRVIKNLNQVLGTIDQRSDQVSRLLVDLQHFTSGLAKDRKAIFNSLQSINDLAGTTEGLLSDVRPTLESDISELNKLSKTLADHDDTLDDVLQRAPGKLSQINRAASYGSFINYYLCSLDAKVALPGAPAITTPRIQNENARCQP